LDHALALLWSANAWLLALWAAEEEDVGDF